jgi:hypothetical protein
LKKIAQTVTTLQEAAESAVTDLSSQHEARAKAKAKWRVEVRKLINDKLAEIDDAADAEDMFVDAVDSEADPVSTETEKALDSAVEEAKAYQQSAEAYAVNMKDQIERLQAQLKEHQEKEEAAAATGPTEAGSTAAASAALQPPSTPTPAKDRHAKLHAAIMQDLNRHFDANAADLPDLAGNPSEEQKGWLASIWHFFKAAPFGQPPAVAFSLLGVPPHFVHSMLGDKIWQGYWQEKSDTVGDLNWIPMSMLPILKHVTDAKAEELSAMSEQEAKAKERMKTAIDGAAKRRKLGYTH